MRWIVKFPLAHEKQGSLWVAKKVLQPCMSAHSKDPDPAAHTFCWTESSDH